MNGIEYKNRYNILNTYVNAVTMAETIDIIKKIVENRIPTQHVVINASKINLMRNDNKLREIVNNCPLINADGASVLWAAKKLGIPINERVTGIDLFLNLLKVANKEKYKIYLFGAKEEVVLKVKQLIESKYPDVKIAGYRNGYFKEDDESEIVKNMADSGADMMFVAFSSPKKEYWINKYIKEINIPFVMGVGGSFDVMAGKTDRAPIWMQKHGLEWFYRFIQEPRRMWKRYIVGNTKFVLYTYKTRRKLKKAKKGNKGVI